MQCFTLSRVSARHRAQIHDVFQSAFASQPSFKYMFAFSDRWRHTRWVGKCKLSLLWPHYHLDVVEDAGEILGYAAWLPPSTVLPQLPAQLRAGFWQAPLRAGLRGFKRMLAFADQERALTDHYGDGRWLLDVIGTHQRHQGRGIGRLLMERGLARIAKRRPNATFILTHNEDNLGFYRHFDFDLVHTATEHEVPAFCLQNAAK